MYKILFIYESHATGGSPAMLTVAFDNLIDATKAVKSAEQTYMSGLKVIKLF